MSTRRHVAALDVGTTTVVCRVYAPPSTTPVGHALGQVKLHFPQAGYVEINPDELWETIITVIRDAINDAKLSANQITALGICSQRATFTTWDRRTGECFHNFIAWNDLRGDKLVKSWNNSFMIKSFKAGAYLLYTVSRSDRFLAGSIFKFMNKQVTMRLLWALQNVTALKQGVNQKNAIFGTIDTWLLYKLTGGKLHVTDYSMASATGLYDPFTLSWAGWALTMLDIPKEILPSVVDTAGDFGHTEESIFGAKIPITASMADQTASMWGSGCFNPGDIKLTMGTGSFLDINTGKIPHASISGLYPLVSWKYGTEIVYMVEGSNNDTGTIIKWAQSAGFLDDPKNSSDIANMVDDTDGVFFIPAFSGLGPPVNDPAAAAGFIGMKFTTRKEHLVRSLLEAIVFRVVQLYRCVLKETSFTFKTIRIDGGVSRNDFVSQLISDMTGLRIERSAFSEISVLGCAFLTGHACGIWKTKEEISSLRKIEQEFIPRGHLNMTLINTMMRWEDAIKRFSSWYQPQVVKKDPKNPPIKHL